METSRKIYGVVFAFLLAGLLTVGPGTASAVGAACTEVTPLDPNGNPLPQYTKQCDTSNGGQDVSTQSTSGAQNSTQGTTGSGGQAGSGSESSGTPSGEPSSQAQPDQAAQAAANQPSGGTGIITKNDDSTFERDVLSKVPWPVRQLVKQALNLV